MMGLNIKPLHRSAAFATAIRTPRAFIPAICCLKTLASLSALTCFLGLTYVSAAHAGGSLGALSAEEKTALQEPFRTTLEKRKGPFGKNVCVCDDGRREPVLRPDGTIQNACGEKHQFCAAFRAPWAEALAEQGVYVGNFFANDAFEWTEFPDHHNLVRGHVLEKYFTDTHPDHKLATAKTLRGVTGAEYEAPARGVFMEKYLALDSFDDSRHFLLAYELQRRSLVHDNVGGIDKARNMATRIEQQDSEFKPLRDAVHNQISAALIPRLAEYQDQKASAEVAKRIDGLIAVIEKLTTLDEDAIRPELAQVETPEVRSRLEERLPDHDATPLEIVEALAQVMALGREAIAEGSLSPADTRRLIDVNVIAAWAIHSQGSAMLDSNEPATVRDYLRFLVALSEASYGA